MNYVFSHVTIVFNSGDKVKLPLDATMVQADCDVPGCIFSIAVVPETTMFTLLKTLLSKFLYCGIPAARSSKDRGWERVVRRPVGTRHAELQSQAPSSDNTRWTTVVTARRRT